MNSVSNVSIYTQALTAANESSVHAETFHTTKKIKQSLSKVYQVYDDQRFIIVEGSVAKSAGAEAKKPPEKLLKELLTGSNNLILTLTYQQNLTQYKS
ncbi:hypothetical protein Rin_00014560 [Candidatus Regiella insecticola 5.15]|uniref:Uncharacterized protein n=1 Tax=Candidatus Regiella insecticola 5.15 TaxID=1005043 RepID=G2H076_9ENTR|nr:hypothetical protein [Candidatus Regiella insecticola]EGY28603.1 hypothetical protein Rin_00014560 [Candidatus Regiella insecticola 5.15]